LARALTLLKDMSRPQPKAALKTVAIVGAGLAGAACASTLARAGYCVTVYEQAQRTAAGASGVPLALFAPSISADDAPHSRLLRRGVHLLLSELQRLTLAGRLSEGLDWSLMGVRERTIRVVKRLPLQWLEPLDLPELQSRMMSEREIFHGAAGWVNPERLIDAWLNETETEFPIKVKTSARIESFADLDADAVIVACGYQTPSLLPSLNTTLQPIRGQVEWGALEPLKIEPLKTQVFNGCLEHAFNGMGHWIATQNIWLAGATFQRDEVSLLPTIKDADKNFEKLATLLPELAKPCLDELRSHAQSWVGVRTAQKNRQPLMAQPDREAYPNLWVSTGLGSRGLSLAALCALHIRDSLG